MSKVPAANIPEIADKELSIDGFVSENELKSPNSKNSISLNLLSNVPAMSLRFSTGDLHPSYEVSEDCP